MYIAAFELGQHIQDATLEILMSYDFKGQKGSHLSLARKVVTNQFIALNLGISTQEIKFRPKEELVRVISKYFFSFITNCY